MGPRTVYDPTINKGGVATSSKTDHKRIAFGYNRDYGRIVINEGQAACVKLIYAYYIEGKSLSEIKEILEGVGIPSPHNGKTWSRQTLANILSNSNYLGSDIYPQIISREDFDRVQDMKSSK